MKRSRVRLPRNVQFIYEHSLAREELERGFGATDIEWNNNDPWEFQLNLNGQADRVMRRAAYVGSVNDLPSDYGEMIRPAYQGGEFNRTRSVNQYLTHWIYPYKGKFHPQMIRAIFNIVGAKPGDLLFEPFSGSGTASLEGQLLGLNALATDISPVCCLLTRVKTGAYLKLRQIRKEVKSLLSGTLSIDRLPTDNADEDVVGAFFQVARLVTISDVENRNRDVTTALGKNLSAMLESVEAMDRARRKFQLELGSVRCVNTDIRKFSAEHASVGADLIITSPPYSVALDYVKNDRHALDALGLDTTEIKDNFIGVAGRGKEQKLARYESDMKHALREMARAVRPGAPVVVIIGNVTVDKTEVYTTASFTDWAADEGLVLEKALPKIVFGLYNVMDDEKILFFRRAA